MLNIPVVSFVGYSGSGKTTLITKIITYFKQKGLKIAVIKHDAHRFEIDHEGKDTWHYQQRGADTVIINSLEKLAIIERLNSPLNFQQVLEKVHDVDLIIVEGYKKETINKILLIGQESDIKLLQELSGVIAIASAIPLSNMGLPVFTRDEFEKIGSFIEETIWG